VVDKKVQDEWPFSIILVLDEFRFQYKNVIMDEEVERVCVPIGHVAIFSGAFLSHCRWDNRTKDYVYCLFAYVVSNEVDYLQGAIERDKKDDIVVWEEGDIEVEGGT
jgi:hypothetical protein